jgi:hypothetical protein
LKKKRFCTPLTVLVDEVLAELHNVDRRGVRLEIGV